MMNDKEALHKLRAEFDELVNKINLSELCAPVLIKKALKIEALLSATK